ncbi:hypothetical protein PVAND_012870 [Polypedilum vanderplanki]|uniref:Uncharacterized protein n=1 Tax=Polypedilum vanderplanki TaxID=319348 RepID=A0A9J6CNQ7_POLVA|nr:hypothetical protein PVAND_012870 [Polypedilum vanderplanki]
MKMFFAGVIFVFCNFNSAFSADFNGYNYPTPTSTFHEEAAAENEVSGFICSNITCPTIPTIPAVICPTLPVIPQIECPKFEGFSCQCPEIPKVVCPTIPKVECPEIVCPEIPEVKCPSIDIPPLSCPPIPEIKCPELPQIPAIDCPTLPPVSVCTAKPTTCPPCPACPSNQYLPPNRK